MNRIKKRSNLEEALEKKKKQSRHSLNERADRYCASAWQQGSPTDPG